ncbi:MAG: agmatine deiminase family protein [Bacteroidetes bacterium]|nr:agmatine deiminase family protein [Bacteroidota bacterium]
MSVVYFSSILKDKAYDQLLSILQKELINWSIGYKFLNNTNDIWCRDYMPVQVGKDQFVQFNLTHDYYENKNDPRITDPASICEELGITPIIPEYKVKRIFLDGGNIIMAHDTAIITERVFDDNKIPKDKLLEILTNTLRVERVIIIPNEPDDYTGHSDGMVRWFDEKTVLVNDYSKAGSNKRFMEKFYGALSGAGLDILLVPYCPVESHSYNQPATGCYINYLKVGNKVFLPTFDDKKNDEKAIERFGEIFGAENIVTVPCKEISNRGGCLNCVSWEILD